MGAHEAEEAPMYEELAWAPVTWVEAQPALAEALKARLETLNNRIIQAAIWNVSNVRLKLHITSNSQSTSLLNLGTHSKSYPDVSVVNDIEVVTKRLDELIMEAEMPDFINIDIQGVEFQALQSLGALITGIRYIYLEVNRKQVYEECATVRQIDKYLKNFGFTRASTRWYLLAGWGDALYLDRTAKPRTVMQKYRNTTAATFFYYKQIPDILKKPINVVRKRRKN